VRQPIDSTAVSYGSGSSVLDTLTRHSASAWADWHWVVGLWEWISGLDIDPARFKGKPESISHEHPLTASR